MGEYEIIPPAAAAAQSNGDFPANLPVPPFRMAIYGHSASGKGVLIANLIGSKRFPYRAVYKRNIFIFSDTISLGDPSFSEVDLAEDHYIKGYDEAVVKKIWDENDAIIAKHGKPKAPHVLLVFDDTVTSLSNNPKSLLRRLFFQGRHSKISTLVTSQSYTALPRAVRTNADTAVFFETNRKQLSIIAEEQSVEAEVFYAMMRAATEEAYSFLVIMYKKPIPQRYQLRFSNKFFEVPRD
jgi:hypothetical protein